MRVQAEGAGAGKRVRRSRGDREDEQVGARERHSKGERERDREKKGQTEQRGREREMEVVRVGARYAERGRGAYLVGRSPVAVRGGGRWCCVRESGDAGEEGGGGVQRMDKVL